MSLTPGARLGPYEILVLLGAGGMGEVWRAKDTRVDRLVALKVLPEEFFEDEERRARFEREAKLLASLNHPGIATLYSFEEIPGSSPSSSRHLLVMELVEGEPLSKRMKAGPISMGEALSIGRDIAEALEVAHAKGVVHRDLKPANVVVSNEGRVKLVDFGLARSFEREPASPDLSHSPTLTAGGTEAGVILGTAAYMSPEQARGQRVDARADVWAFGVVLYEMLTGGRLFRGESIPDTLAAVLREPVDFKRLPLSTPREVRDLLSRCLERHPEKRLTNIGEARRTLEKSESGGGITRAVGLRLAAVVGLLLLVAAGGVFLARRRSAAPAATAASSSPSIAVLPFTNLSGDKEQEYFSDGLSDEIMGLLTRVKDLKVTGRTSSFAFKGKIEDLRAIGQKLNVATLLEGSVRRSGDRLRVATRLVNVVDGFQIWAETYDRKLTDVFAVQDEIAGAVVAALKVTLQPQEGPTASQHRTSNPEAYNQYLLGRQFSNRRNFEGFRRAHACYANAIALDRSYTAAYAGLAIAEFWMSEDAETAAAEAEGRQKALAAADRAIALDRDLAEGHSARGTLRFWITWDWAGAQSDFQRALLLDPGDSNTLNNYSLLLSSVGRLPEAIAATRKATALDPLSDPAWHCLGRHLNASGQLAEARKAFLRALEINPERQHTHFHFGVTSLLGQDPKTALAEFRREPPDTHRLAGVAMAEHDLRHPMESQQALEELIAKDAQGSAYQIANVFGWRGDRDKAFEWLDRAYAQRDAGLSYLMSDPLLAKLRGDPRYAALLKKMNLPVAN